MSCYCEKCGKTMSEKEFYTSRNIEKYPPDGKLRQCKKCMTMHVDNWDPETYKWILEEIDVPYVKEWWDDLLSDWLEKNDASKITGLSILGKYLAKMRIKQYSDYRWADSERVAEELMARKVVSMKAKGFTGEEIEAQLSMDRTPARPEELAAGARPEAQQAQPEFSIEEDDTLIDQLTEEDKLYLQMKWGRSYRADEWIKMEQLYMDMMASYDIQGAGHKDTLIMICKASLKANQCIDAGDIEGFQKMSKVYDQLMKSGKFQAVQNKSESGDFVDSVGEIVVMCEKDGFIPRYHTDGPQDKADRTLQDLQDYTRTLVTEELNLGNMIEMSMKEIAKDREREAQIDVDDAALDDALEETLFSEDADRFIKDEDFVNFREQEEEQAEEDEALLENILTGKET